MKIGIKRAKDDPLRLVLQVEELEEDMTAALLAMTHHMRPIVEPEAVGLNAVEFGLPEDLKEEDIREIKIALVNTTRAVLNDPKMIQTLMQQGPEAQLVALPRETMQGLLDELANLRLQAGRGEVKIEALQAQVEEAKHLITDFLRLFNLQRRLITFLVIILGILGALGALNFIWRLF